MGFNLRLLVANEPTLGALVGLPVYQLMLGQVVFPDKGLGADRALEVPVPVGGDVLPQGGVLREPLVTHGALVRQLFGMRAVVGQQLRLVPQHLVTQAALLVGHVVLGVVGQTLGVVKLPLAHPARSLGLAATINRGGLISHVVARSGRGVVVRFDRFIHLVFDLLFQRVAVEELVSGQRLSVGVVLAT